MEKLCRTATTLYRVPRIGQLNLRLSSPLSTNATLGSSATRPESNNSANNHLKPGWNLQLQRNYSGLAFGGKPRSSGARSMNLNGGGSLRMASGEASNQEGQLEHISDILEREIQEETAEMSQQLSTDQFPGGFSVETDDADVKLTKQVRDATVVVRCTVSSSLSEWPCQDQQSNQQQQQQDDESAGPNMSLVSMPEFQVQITRNGKTLELSCYFEEMDPEEAGANEEMNASPLFSVDELVVYEGEPKETEFAVNAEYFSEDLQEALLQYLAEYSIDDEFAKNLVNFATSYEKKQYISLMKRLKNFVST